ncbi:MAG TPA: type II secretion system F family protein [Acidimicrobiia bacterium]|nr:type II secretion system F family protein [Acidimicrobiia bacterium]
MELLSSFLELRDKAKLEKEKVKAEKSNQKEMPHVYGLMAVASSSGLSGELAIRAIVPFAPDSVADPMRRSLLHIDSGKSFRSAIEEWYLVENLRPMAHILIESMESGTSSIPAFDALGRDALNKVRRNSDTAMKKLPIKMLFPLVICILPAFILLSVVPTLISGFTQIQW